MTASYLAAALAPNDSMRARRFSINPDLLFRLGIAVGEDLGRFPANLFDIRKLGLHGLKGMAIHAMERADVPVLYFFVDESGLETAEVPAVGADGHAP